MTTEYPKDGSWFVVEAIDRTVYRWQKYKPQGARQMGVPGRWQRQVWRGDYFDWENCSQPEGAFTRPAEDGPITLALKAAQHVPTVELTAWQSPEPSPSHGGPAVNTYWAVAVNGVQISMASDRRHWETDLSQRQKYMGIQYAPSELTALYENLQKALSQEKT